MAEEKKESKGQKRYGNPPKIKGKGKKPGEANAEAKEKSSEGGDSKLMGKDTQGAPTADAKLADASPGAAPEASPMSGTDGIPIQTRHANERDEMSKRHAKEVHQMHSRHADEHAAMIEKHKGDMGGAEMSSAEAGTGVATAGQ